MIKSISEEIKNNEKIKKDAIEKQEKINDKRYKKLLNKKNGINQKYLNLALEIKEKNMRNKYFNKYKKESEKTNKLRRFKCEVQLMSK